MLNDYEDILRELHAASRLRSIPESADSSLIDFTGNDYLGIAATRRVEEEFIRTLTSAGDPAPFTSSASRLLAGRQKEYAELEDSLAGAYGKRALLFNSGYHANAGCVSALAVPDTLLVTDKLVHASIIDGVRLSRSPFKRFPHNDMARLRRLLAAESGNYKRIWVIVESIYSMDGDEAPLLELVQIKKEYPNVALYVDEAHGLGVRGESGLGLCEELGILNDIDLIILTFGKAAASMGAAALCSPAIHDFLVNSARSFIFSTVLPPVNVAYTLHTFRTLRDMGQQRSHLMNLSRRLREGLEELTGMPNPSTSQIVPWIIGDNRLTVEYAGKLRDAGLLTMPIRRPTVAEGTERIRFSLSATLTENDVERLLHEIKRIVDA